MRCELWKGISDSEIFCFGLTFLLSACDISTHSFEHRINGANATQRGKASRAAFIVNFEQKMLGNQGKTVEWHLEK
jgi:hypothetical protein